MLVRILSLRNYFLGNELSCDCFIRPLHRYFTKNLELKEHYKQYVCAGPPHLEGQKLYEVLDDRLTCPLNVNTSKMLENEPEYDITPDFKFRDIQM